MGLLLFPLPQILDKNVLFSSGIEIIIIIILKMMMLDDNDDVE